MLRTFARRASAAAVPLLTLPVIMLVAAPGTAQASAPGATIQLQSQAQLLANGSIVVTVGFSCQPSQFGSAGFLEVRASQNGVTGFADTSVTCDDQKHTVSLDVGPGPFTPGTAGAFALVEDDSGTTFANTSAELTVK